MSREEVEVSISNTTTLNRQDGKGISKLNADVIIQYINDLVGTDPNPSMRGLRQLVTHHQPNWLEDPTFDGRGLRTVTSTKRTTRTYTCNTQHSTLCYVLH